MPSPAARCSWRNVSYNGIADPSLAGITFTVSDGDRYSVAVQNAPDAISKDITSKWNGDTLTLTASSSTGIAAGRWQQLDSTGTWQDLDPMIWDLTLTLSNAQTGQQYRYCGKGYENWSNPYTVTPPPAAPAFNPPPAADVPATGDSTPLALLGLLAALSAAGMWLMKRRTA